MLTQLDIQLKYDAYSSLAAQRLLTPPEKAFLLFCQDCHQQIFDENKPLHSSITRRATRLFKKIMDYPLLFP